MALIEGVLYGERDYHGVHMLVHRVTCFALCLRGAFVLFVLLFPQAVLSLFNIPPLLASEVVKAVRLFAVSTLGVTATFLIIFHYTTVQQRTAANILFIVEGLLAVVPAAWILSKAMGLTGVWLPFILAELVGFACLYLYVRFVCKRSDGKLTDFYLIEKIGKELLYDVSLKGTEQDAAKLSREAISILHNNGVEEGMVMMAGFALEEMTANLVNYPNNKQAADIDIRIKQC